MRRATARACQRRTSERVRTVRLGQLLASTEIRRHAGCTIDAPMHPVMIPERRRLLDRLIREICRSETQASEHASRLEKLIGRTPPVQALCEVSTHALAMRARFDHIVEAHELPLARTSISATLATLRGLVTDRGIDPERT